MNRIVLSLIIIFSLILSACNNSGNKISADDINNPNTASGKIDMDQLPMFEFETEEHDFGKITEGEKISYAFKFKNTGKSDLIISNAKASCGCTVPEYPTTPVKPGEEGKIIISFNSDGRKGINNKTVVLTANTQPNTKVLTIKAEVVSL
jgi:hypothetical protein